MTDINHQCEGVDCIQESCGTTNVCRLEDFTKFKTDVLTIYINVFWSFEQCMAKYAQYIFTCPSIDSNK